MGLEIFSEVETKRVGSFKVILFSLSITPDLKVIDEICPSPVARKLKIKRRLPSGKSDWSGCHTIEGLKMRQIPKNILV